MSILFITTGIVGSGKSTAAELISKEFDAEILSTDVARKEMLKIDKDKKKFEEYGKGVYSKKMRGEVYEILFEAAEKKLRNQKNVVIDASFQKQEQREMAKQTAYKTNSKFIMVYCYAPEDKIRKWLAKRSKEGSVSDGRVEILEDFKRNFDEVNADENTISIDTSKEGFLKEIKEKIKSKIKDLP